MPNALENVGLTVGMKVNKYSSLSQTLASALAPLNNFAFMQSTNTLVYD